MQFSGLIAEFTVLENSINSDGYCHVQIAICQCKWQHDVTPIQKPLRMSAMSYSHNFTFSVTPFSVLMLLVGWQAGRVSGL